MENNTLQYSAPVPRPDLRKESVALTTVKSVGISTVIFSALEGVIQAHDKISKTNQRTLRDSVISIAGWTALNGLVSMVLSIERNDQKKKVRPYVERLESELAAKNAVLDNSLQK